MIKTRSQFVQDFIFGAGVKSPIFNMFVGLFGDSQFILPKTNFARYVLMMFLMYSLVIRTAYQGSYFDILQSNQAHGEVKPIDEMIKKDFTFYGSLENVGAIRNIESKTNRFSEIHFGLLNNLLTLKSYRIDTIAHERRNDLLMRIQDDASFKGAYTIIDENSLRKSKN